MKTPKTFRLDDATMNRLSWLAHELHTTETDIVQTAITNLYLSQYYDLPGLSVLPPDENNPPYTLPTKNGE